MFCKLALKSLLDRKGSVLLSLIAMTVSIFVLLGVESIRHQAKENFASSVSGIDLIVGAKTGSLNLLLYSVFRIGAPTNNMSWDTFEYIASTPDVAWAIPISLGDSHKGFPVIGTTAHYFEHYRYGKKHNLELKQGEAFKETFDVVLGHHVAKELGYQLGNKLVLAHGVAKTSFSLHDDRPFTVVGILEPTGTQVDQSLHVSLEGIEAIHMNWQQGGNSPFSHDVHKEAQLEPREITAMMLGLKSKMLTFKIQREINNFKKEPLVAILPGVALSELWQMIGFLENTLRLVSILVFAAACLGVSAMLLSSMRERGQDIQLLRVIGARPQFIFMLIEFEAFLITLLSIVLGAGLLTLSFFMSKDYLLANFGLNINTNLISRNSLVFCIGMLISSIIIAMIPSISGYVKALNNKP